ncbi:hypothetical protein OHA70_39055 [Kribbella sp. NBC_00382]|uniref:hypothetical protein n=1 Tax=Kribbella sp. NBC_00382 TaxID=2975967 RepID=UPI002E1AE6F0
MNLMCPARLILLPPGSRERLAGERIAAVYATAAATGPATQLADELSVRLTLLPAAQHPAPANPSQADRRLVEAMVREIADQHRGETVVVIAPDLNLGIDLPAVIEHEGDGWHVVAAGTPG